MVLYRVISEILDVKKYRDLQIRVRGHSWSLTVVPFYSNFFPKMHRFWDIRLVSMQCLETWVRGHSRSSEPARIDLPPMFMTSY